MRRIGGNLLLSPSDLNTFLVYHHSSARDCRRLDEILGTSPADPAMEILQQN
jgi:hypothetical protein